MDLLERISFGLKAGKRIVDTTMIVSRNSLGIVWDMLAGKEQIAPVRLRRSFEELGATYIKLGQLVASAPSLFPRPYVEEFQKCLDQVNPLPFSVIRRVIEEDLGGPIGTFFRSVEEEPLASASVAQVHGAVLHSGADVVLKVQRPDVEDKLKIDMTFLEIAAGFLEKIAPGFSRTSLSGILEDFHKILLEEIDFVREAKNIVEFDRFLKQIGETRAVVPWVYRDTTTKRVLTMERLYGTPLTDLDSLRGITDRPDEVLLTALNVWYQSLAVCGFFHADVHAGNLLVLEDARVAFIDFGIVGRIPDEVWMGLLMLMQAMAVQDYSMMAQALVRTGATHEDVDVALFARDLEKIFSVLDPKRPERMLTMTEVEMNGLIMDIAETGERHGIRFPRAFALLMKQMLYFDRYVQLLAPRMDIIHDTRLKIPGKAR